MCRSLGISHRRFLGWEPRTWTRPLPDGSTETRREPEFDGWERMLWRAFDDYEAGFCPGCRQPLSECLLDETVPEDQRPQYVAGHRVCLGCAAAERAQILHAERDAETNEADAEVRKRAGADPKKAHLRHPATPHARQYVVMRAN